MCKEEETTHETLEEKSLIRNKDVCEEKTATNKTQQELRQEWSNPFDFFISCLGYAVGLGLFQNLYL